MEGDSIDKIAYKAGLYPATIWDHPNNSELRKHRAHRNELEPGDRIFVPEKNQKKLPCAVDKRYRFLRMGVPSLLRLQALQDFGPRKGEPYRLEVDGSVFTGSEVGNQRQREF